MALNREADPLGDLVQVQRRMNQLFETALTRTDFETQQDFDSWSPVCDVRQSAEQLAIWLELPGMDQAQIELRIDGDELVVEGERRMEREHSGERFHRVECSYGRFARRFRLPSTVDRDAVEAQYRNGVLRVTLPARSDAGPQTRRVEIG